MRIRRDIYNMDERELKKYARVIRLRRERRKKCLTLAVSILATFCMLLICTISYRSIGLNANDGFKYYTSITVEAGDSLWGIADNYMDEHYADRDSYIAEVRSINHLDEAGTIMTGQTLIVPYYSSEYLW